MKKFKTEQPAVFQPVNQDNSLYPFLALAFAGIRHTT
jgi:hypothetical protein